MNIVLTILWFFLPASAAIMAPVFFRWLIFAKSPALGKKFKRLPLVGSSKTYRDFVTGILAAMIFIYLQKLINSNLPYSIQVDYSVINNIWEIGFLMGFGAVAGNWIKNSIKKRLNIKLNGPWLPYDQLAWIIGAVIAVGFILRFETKDIVIVVLVFGCLHLLVNLASNRLKLKPNKI